MLLSLLALGCAHLPPFPTPPVDYGEVVDMPLVTVPEDSRRLYVVVPDAGGGEQLWFFDTGYSHTTCDAQMIEASEIRSRWSAASTRGELGVVRLRRARLPDFELGGHQVRGLRCAVRDLPATSSIPEGEGYRVAGVLGSNVLRRFVVEVDPAAGVLRLHPPGSVDMEGATRLRRERLAGQRLKVPLSLDGEALWPVLDYGATGTYLDAERLGLPLYRAQEGTWKGTGGAGAETRIIRYHQAEAVALAGVPAPSIYVVDRPGRGSGLVGMNVLRHYRLVVDYPGRAMTVEPVEPATLPVYGLPVYGEEGPP